jgi:organic radical activating enzyme
MTQSKPLKAGTEKLTPIDDIAAAWGVSNKAVQNWCEFVYQAFEIILPSNGPFPEWSTQLLTLTAKHISVKANLYFAETGEKRRLKGSEFVGKIRRMRSEGHFQEFQKFQNFQNVQDLTAAEDLEDSLLAEVGQLTRESDERIAKLKRAIEQRENQQVDELVEFVEDSDHRVLSKLTSRLQTSKILKAAEEQPPCIDDAIDVAYQRLP